MFARFHSNRPRQRLPVRLRLILDSDGSSAVEYAVTLALISVAMLASVLAVGSGSAELFRSLARELNSAEGTYVPAPSLPAPMPRPATTEKTIKVTTPGSVSIPGGTIRQE